jgi:hypothetical protein
MRLLHLIASHVLFLYGLAADKKLSKARMIDSLIAEIKQDEAKFQSLRSSGFLDTKDEPALNPKIK